MDSLMKIKTVSQDQRESELSQMINSDVGEEMMTFCDALGKVASYQESLIKKKQDAMQNLSTYQKISSLAATITKLNDGKNKVIFDCMETCFQELVSSKRKLQGKAYIGSKTSV